MKYILTNILLFYSFILFPQLPYKQSVIISNHILDNINALRQNKGIKPLNIDSSLYLAANFHSTYMARVNRLSHKQSVRKYKTPDLRVKKFSNEFKLTGENIFKVEKTKKKLNNEKSMALADQIFNSWKNSPEHFANMMNPKFELCGFGFFRNNKGALYATNVFGAKGIKIKGQLSDNAFSIKEGKKECYNLIEDNLNVLTYMGNNVYFYDEYIAMYFHNKKMLQKLFVNNYDGIAVDLINREQFICGQENHIDMSPIYDGVMLKPIFKEKLFSNNVSKNDYRFIGNIGKIPNNLVGKKIKPSLIYIKNGKKCSYNIPCSIPSESYKLAPINPIFKDYSKYSFYNKGIVNTQTVFFNFERGVTAPKEKAIALKSKGKPTQISIVSYSSIEGDSVINKKLENQRAEYIKNYIHKKYPLTKSIEPVISTTENWETMYYQLELLKINNIAAYSKEKIREFILNDKTNNWDSLLFIQRKSHATVFYEGNLTPKDSSYYKQNLYTAIKNNNWNIVNKAMDHIYCSKQNGSIVFNPNVFDFIIKHPELVQNSSALLSECYYFNIEQTIFYLRKWINNYKKLDNDALFNLCILYCKVVDYTFSDWDVSGELITNVIHPNKVLDIINIFNGSKTHNLLILNYHITAISYFGQINDYTGIKASFDFISDYFQKLALNINDEIKLCLFYNKWGRFDLTIEKLLQRIDNKDFNEEAAFILAQSIMGYPYKQSEEEQVKSMKMALQKNKQRFCDWINEDFQYLRFKGIKNLYCKECEN